METELQAPSGRDDEKTWKLCEVAHNMQRGWARLAQEGEEGPWSALDETEKNAFYDLCWVVVDHEHKRDTLKPRLVHSKWYDLMREAGWCYGDEYGVIQKDEQDRVQGIGHPLMQPWDDLGSIDQARFEVMLVAMRASANSFDPKERDDKRDQDALNAARLVLATEWDFKQHKIEAICQGGVLEFRRTVRVALPYRNVGLGTAIQRLGRALADIEVRP